MEPLINASFIASFLAGVAALFAPCCITVLLPTYFASIFRQKTTIFLMTFIYFLGLLVVFLPIGLGASALTQVFSSYHNTIFSLGAIFLVLLGAALITGRHLALPFMLYPQLKNYDFGSVFVLGIFSGVATTCCAPVLAGVLALSILPGSVILGGAYALTYVLGMVVPLFIIALLIDKTNLTQRAFFFKKTVSYTLFSKKVSTTISAFLSGLMFLILGVIIFYFAKTNQLTSHSAYQLTVNIYLAKLTRTITNLTETIPEFVWLLLFGGLFLLILKSSISQILSLLKDKRKEVK